MPGGTLELSGMLATALLILLCWGAPEQAIEEAAEKAARAEAAAALAEADEDARAGAGASLGKRHYKQGSEQKHAVMCAC